MSQRRERKDAIEHRKLILQTAQTLFDEYGVGSVSMHQIAKTAGVGQATLYRRYAHKGDLCSELLVDYSQRLMENIESYLRDAAELPPSDRIGGIIDRFIDALEEKADMIATMEARMTCDPRGNFFHTPLYAFLRDRIAELIAEIVGADAQRKVDPTMAAHSLICSMAPPGYFHLKQEMGYSIDRIKSGYLQMCRFAERPS